MLVSPSVISCRLENLASEISHCEKAGVYSYHLDYGTLRRPFRNMRRSGMAGFSS
jgi:hypothetical protein